MSLISFAEFKERAHAWNSDLSDTIAKTDDVTFQSPDLIAYSNGNGDIKQLFGDAYIVKGHGQLTDHAKGQFSERLGVPGKWLFDDEKCPDELRSMVADWKLERAKLSWLIRSRNNGMKVRGILSDEYRPYNHLQFINAIEKALEVKGLEPEVLVRQFSDELRAYILFPQIDFGKDRDNGGSADRGGIGGLHPAVYTGNSEIGTMGVTGTGGTYRSYCQNGQIYGWSTAGKMRVIHRWYTEAEMEIKVNEMIVEAFKLSEEMAEKFIESRAVELKPQRMGDLIDEWATKYGLLVPNKEAWASMVDTHTKEQEDYSLFDFVNDASFVARGIEDPNQRQVLEILAGDLVERGVAVQYQRN